MGRNQTGGNVDEGSSLMVGPGVIGGLCGEEVGRTMGRRILVMRVQMAMWGVDEVCLSLHRDLENRVPEMI